MKICPSSDLVALINGRCKIWIQERNFWCFFYLKYLLRTSAMNSLLKFQHWDLELAGPLCPRQSRTSSLTCLCNHQELQTPRSSHSTLTSHSAWNRFMNQHEIELNDTWVFSTFLVLPVIPKQLCLSCPASFQLISLLGNCVNL